MRPRWPSAPPTPRRSCAASREATSSTRPTRRWPSSARRPRPSSCAATSHAEGAPARDPRGAERGRDLEQRQRFIFFGKGGEVASNRLDDQEFAVHALHLLQSCLVYVNTLMLQRVLAEPAWMARMTPADLRGLTPLVWGHVSPMAFQPRRDDRRPPAQPESSGGERMARCRRLQPPGRANRRGPNAAASDGPITATNRAKAATTRLGPEAGNRRGKRPRDGVASLHARPASEVARTCAARSSSKAGWSLIGRRPTPW